MVLPSALWLQERVPQTLFLGSSGSSWHLSLRGLVQPKKAVTEVPAVDDRFVDR